MRHLKFPLIKQNPPRGQNLDREKLRAINQKASPRTRRAERILKKKSLNWRLRKSTSSDERRLEAQRAPLERATSQNLRSRLGGARRSSSSSRPSPYFVTSAPTLHRDIVEKALFTGTFAALGRRLKVRDPRTSPRHDLMAARIQGQKAWPEIKA